MIECDRLPVFFLVAGLALIAKVPFVLVIALVTTDTSRCKLFIYQIGLVASIAFGSNVLAQQGEFGVLVMIEFGSFPPGLGVAGLAFHAQAALVNVVLAMARIAIGRCFASLPVQRLLVARHAFDRFMLAQ